MSRRQRSRAVFIPRPTASLLRFLAFGSAVQTILLGGFFLVPFSHLWGQMPSVPPESEAALAEPSWTTALTVAFVFALPSLLPFVLLMRMPALEWDVRLSVLLSAGAIGLVLLPALVALGTYPCCTSDVLDYVNRQRLWIVYGGNPFAVTPNDHPDDWSYSFTYFKDSVFGYGPVWWLISRAFTQWANALDQYLLGFKLLAATSLGVSSLLIWRLAEGGGRLRSLTFFAWSPVVLIDGVLRLHNDLLTVPLVLAAVWLWKRNHQEVLHSVDERPAGSGWRDSAGRGWRDSATWQAASLAMVALAALVKLTVAPLGLAIAAGLIRARSWRALVLGVVLSMLAVAVLYAPFWYGPGTLAALLVQANRPHWAFGDALLYAFGGWLGSATLPTVRLLLGGAFVVVVLVVLARYANGSNLVETAALLMLAGLLSFPLAFYSHYLTPVMALAALARDERVRWLVLAVSFGAMINNVLGVDSLTGGVSGAWLDIIGSAVIIAGVVVGLLVARATSARPVPAA